jgi:hypothetical protein
VCGDLNLSGTWSFGNAVIVIENGSLNIQKNANVTFTNSTIVMTGDDAHNHYIVFPNGLGQQGTLNIEGTTTTSNPWYGIAMFADPAVHQNLASTWGTDWWYWADFWEDAWGPGANFNFDGVVYLPNTDLTIHGNTQSSGEKCSKLIVNSLVADGAATINFSQSYGKCVSAGVTTNTTTANLVR